MIGARGAGLIFLLSQPRAGSTLLQRMLGAHPQLHTTQEPWIALHPLFALRDGGYEALYGVAGERLFVRDFLATLPDGEEHYVEALRGMLRHLYDAALEPTGRHCFLDKSPRYYLILPELLRLFPDARFILLLRNPLAVLGSILSSWVRGEWLGLAHARPDLLHAPSHLIEGRRLLGARATVVHYEALVREPAASLHALCTFLDLPFTPQMVHYGDAALPPWPHGDRKSVYRYRAPEPAQARRWRDGLAHPQVWRLSREYLDALGPARVAALGYDFEGLTAILNDNRPPRHALWATLPLSWLLRAPPARRTRLTRRAVWLLRRFLQPPYPPQ